MTLGSSAVHLVGNFDDQLVRAVRDALAGQPWTVRAEDTDDPAQFVLVRLPASHALPDWTRAIALVDPVRLACAHAVIAFREGVIGSAIPVVELSKLPYVLDVVSTGSVVLSHSVLAGARQVPDLSERQSQVLSYRLAGLSDRAIGARIGFSSATVRRTSIELCRIFDVENRAQLVDSAASLGFVASEWTEPRPPTSRVKG
jgi:DNA-binding CsgD family transcriptional regulator